MSKGFRLRRPCLLRRSADQAAFRFRFVGVVRAGGQGMAETVSAEMKFTFIRICLFIPEKSGLYKQITYTLVRQCSL